MSSVIGLGIPSQPIMCWRLLPHGLIYPDVPDLRYAGSSANGLAPAVLRRSAYPKTT